MNTLIALMIGADIGMLLFDIVAVIWIVATWDER